MSTPKSACPICKHSEGFQERRLDQSMSTYHCPVCGDYDMPHFVPEIHGTESPNHKLSAWVREQNEGGVAVRFTQQGMIENILAGIPDYRPLDKQLKLLKAVERLSNPPGTYVKLSRDTDFPLAYAAKPKEFTFYLQSLEERGLIRSSQAIGATAVVITPTGWDYLDEHASNLKERKQAFVAMSFSAAMKPVWKDAIRPAIEKAGYVAYRVDEELHSDNIIFKIMAEIKNSRFVVADITEQNNGVYFEAGYALGLGLPVIWSVRKDDIRNVHFDTAQYNQIRWESPKDLEEGLYDYVCAIIGERSQSQT
jgi:nucleoside 2-deoxyribosyltransferase